MCLIKIVPFQIYHIFIYLLLHIQTVVVYMPHFNMFGYFLHGLTVLFAVKCILIFLLLSIFRKL